jgi:quercetin dioxygenase-like cupin family protein
MKAKWMMIVMAGIACTGARAQDPVKVAPNMAKLEFENEQIRVVRVKYGPHEKFPMHSHATGKIAVALTETKFLVTAADGTTQTSAHHAGDIYWNDAAVHRAENLLDAPAEAIEIEIKAATSLGVAVTASPVDASKLKEPVPVQDEPHHHPAYQNQYVRVQDVFFPVGDPALFHTHSNDNVSVELSGDKSHSQDWKDKDSGKWNPAGDVVPGRMAFHKAVGQPYTHRVGSAGEKPFHVIDVEVLPSTAK